MLMSLLESTDEETEGLLVGRGPDNGDLDGEVAILEDAGAYLRF